MVVKRVIRSKVTRKYLQAEGAWTDDPAQAICFPDIWSVIKTSQTYELVDVELLLWTGDQPGNFDVTLALPNFGGISD